MLGFLVNSGSTRNLTVLFLRKVDTTKLMTRTSKALLTLLCSENSWLMQSQLFQ